METKNLLFMAVYSIGFALLYLAVLLIIPPSNALTILNTCASSSGSMATNLLSAPVSYFEVLVFAVKYHISTTSGIWPLFLFNFFFVDLIVLYSFFYFSKSTQSHAFNPHKTIWSGVAATYLLSLVYAAINRCGTGTSIIGFSISVVLLFCIGYDIVRAKKERAGAPLRTIVLFAFIFAFSIGYLAEPIIHLSGLLIFVILLSLWDKNFKAGLIGFLKTVRLRLR